MIQIHAVTVNRVSIFPLTGYILILRTPTGLVLGIGFLLRDQPLVVCLLLTCKE